MGFAIRFVPLALFMSRAAGGAVELTKDTFDNLAIKGGKNAFVKFLAPW